MGAATPISEDGLIARYFKPLARDPGAFGLVDDAAILRSEGEDIVVTTDAIVEGVHFLSDDPPETIARKALRVNLSDLAAKGAAPAGFVLTLALRDATDEWLEPFARALGEDSDDYLCPLLGGDTVSTSGPIMISITIFGRVPRDRMVKRSTARAGDIVVVSGTIGDAALGLAILKGELSVEDFDSRQNAVSRYRVPQPRTALAQVIRTYASAAMDVSDGLAGDLSKLCRASGLSADVDLLKVPLSDLGRSVIETGQMPFERLIAGGDDYELLCTVGPDHLDGLLAEANRRGIAMTAIGTVKAGQEAVSFRDASGQLIHLARLSYSHF
jgi:thiamine-monophosphate kinase